MEDYSQDFDNYDLQGSGGDPVTGAGAYVDTYDAYDYGGGGQAGWQGSPELAATVMESLQVTGINLDAWKLSGPNGGGDSYDLQNVGGAPGAAGQTPSSITAGEPSITEKFGKFLTGAGEFASKYKVPLEMLGRGVAGAMKSKEDAKAAQRLSDNRMAELNKNYELRAGEMRTADTIKQEGNARYSDSVKGLRTGGLINSGKLIRKDGSQVYANNGLINRS
ncbi:MAG: hypothetical protein V4730_11670 [Pseudomonadota bacterium]